MSVVDKGFLIWLEYQDREELLEYIDLPAPDALPLSVIEEKEWGNRFIEEKE
jgi:hypothetical protein